MWRRKKIERQNQNRKMTSLFANKSDFSVLEAYKTIRTNLMFAVHKTGCKRILISSTVPNEGKTANCCNLGITLAQTGSSVLIIDCDLRKPELHKFFNQKSIPGLSEVLAGMNTPAQVISNSGYDNLQLMLGGTVPPNPAELLSSNAMDELLFELCEDYEYILLDTPPINVVTDTMALSTKVDGVVMVVKEGVTTHPELRRALASLEFVQARVLGIVLNEVKRKGGFRYGQYGQYGYIKKYREYYNDYVSEGERKDD